MNKIDILSLSLSELEEEFLSIGEKKFRARQVFNWLHAKKITSFEEMTNISLELRTKIDVKFYIKQLFISRRLESSIDNTVKYLYRLSDGNYIETVLMEYNYGLTLCISTQAGCRMGCKFCASAIAGFVRNLEPSEMLSQIYNTERECGKKISGIVLMGIGEPLDNYENVLKFLKILNEKEGYGLSLRHVTVSTCGIVPKIDKLADEKLGITLSVSLHSPSDEKRSEIMPVNKAYNINELIASCKRYVSKTGRRVTFEYAVIDGVNSSEKDAQKLSELVRGINCHINLIPINRVKERNFKSSRKAAVEFQNILINMGVNATVRRTLGSDINAACGQLRREAEKNG